jgi:hypothetical protein
MSQNNGSGPSAETSTLEPNPTPPETEAPAGAASGPAQPTGKAPRRRQPRKPKEAAKPQVAEEITYAAPTEAQMQEIGRLAVFAAKHKLSLDEYAADLQRMLKAYDQMVAYAKSRGDG